MIAGSKRKEDIAIIGQRVRAARQAKKMKTEELAEKVNIAVESTGHIECGARKPSLNLLFNIAEYDKIR